MNRTQIRIDPSSDTARQLRDRYNEDRYNAEREARGLGFINPSSGEQSPIYTTDSRLAGAHDWCPVGMVTLTSISPPAPGAANQVLPENALIYLEPQVSAASGTFAPTADVEFALFRSVVHYVAATVNAITGAFTIDSWEYEDKPHEYNLLGATNTNAVTGTDNLGGNPQQFGQDQAGMLVHGIRAVDGLKMAAKVAPMTALWAILSPSLVVVARTVEEYVLIRRRFAETAQSGGV